MRALRGWGWLAAFSCLLLFAHSAVAAPKRPVTRAGDFAAFAVRGSDGYLIEILAVGRRLIVLSASKGHVAAVYTTRGRIAGNRIEARLGNLGRISVAFGASRGGLANGPPRGGSKRSRGCAGGTGAVQAGVFRGVIRFSGERGYTTVSARRASGIVVRPGRNACASARRAERSGALSGGMLTTHLVAVSKRAGRTASIDVLGFPAPRVWVQASTEERRAGMAISRFAYAVVGGSNAFVTSATNQHPAFAVLRPPKPFSGTGTFQEHADLGPSWTGTLSVWLPGAGKVSLAGPAFASSFCKRPRRGPACALFPPVRRRLGIVQGSGSQSQLFGDARLSWSR